MSDRRITESSSPSEVIAALRELIEALDCRVPHADRSGEIRIGKDAAMLRNEAVTRIAALQHTGLNHPAHDRELVDAIMTDDGSPTPGGEKRRADGTPD
jgi:hypothetical protein